MNNFQVYIKNLEQRQIFQLEITDTLETLVNSAINEFKLPTNATARIQCEGSDYHPSTPLFEFMGKKITLQYEHSLPLIFTHFYLKDTTITTNVLATQLEFENAIKAQLLVDYKVRLLANPKDWKERTQKNIQYKVVSNFFIFYQNSFKFFTIDVFETLEAIKNYIQESFSLTKPFQLLYNNKILSEHAQFYQNLIPDNQELQIVLKDKVQIVIDYKGIHKQYKVSFIQSMDSFKNFLRKQYEIEQGINFNLEDQENKNLLKIQDLLDNQLIFIRLLDYELNLFIQFKESPISFPIKILSNQMISHLDNLSVCQNKKLRYFKDQIELNKTKTFKEYFQKGDVQTIQLVFPDYYEYDITFQNKYFPQQLQKIKILTNQTIEEGMVSLIPKNQEYTVLYKNNEVNPKKKFQEIGIKDQDMMSYYFNFVTVGAFYKQMLNFDLNLNWTGHQLQEFFSQQLKLPNLQLIYNKVPYPLDQKFQSLYKQDLHFIIENTMIQVKINVPTFDIEINEEFEQKASIFDVKAFVRINFNIPDHIGIFISYQDHSQTGNVQLSELDLQTYPLLVDFQQEINVSFVNEKDELIQNKDVNLGDQLQAILQKFCDLAQVTCYHNNSQIDIQKSFIDLNIQQNDKIQVIKDSFTLSFRSKGSVIDYNSKGRPLDSLRIFFNKISPRQARFYLNNVLQDQQKTVAELNIPNNSVILYEPLVNVTFTKIQGSLICTRVLSIHTLLVNSLKGVCNKQVLFFYNNKHIDENLSLQQTTNQDQITIAFEEAQQQITVFDEFQKLSLLINIQLTLHDVAKKLKFNVQFKQFYSGDYLLLINTKLFTLFNEDNQIVLYFRGPVKQHQIIPPPPRIQVNNLKFTLIHEQTETQYHETVEKSLLVKDYIVQFQSKSGLQNIKLLYEGVEIEKKKSFEDLQIPNEAKIKLEY